MNNNANNLRIALVLLLLSAMAGTPALAQTSAADIVAQAQQRAATIQEYRALLSNPDQNVRVAGLDVMLASDDAAMREIAFNLAFASADDTMRAIALRNKLRYLKNLNFQMTLREGASEKEVKAISQVFGHSYPMILDKYDANSGAFTFAKSYGSGQVSGTGISFNDNYAKCNATLALGDGPILEGSMNCIANNGRQGSFLLSLTLQ